MCISFGPQCNLTFVILATLVNEHVPGECHIIVSHDDSLYLKKSVQQNDPFANLQNATQEGQLECSEVVVILTITMMFAVLN